MRLVQDTNVFVAALKSGAGASRRFLLRLLDGEETALMGEALWFEHQDVIARERLWQDSELSLEERREAADDLASVCEYVRIWLLWRPNLADEADNHVMELALHGRAESLVTFNGRDFDRAEFAPPGLRVETPGDFLERLR